jgi:hypothetical protein
MCPATRDDAPAVPTRFILYVVWTSPSPDRCEGSVPWRIDSGEIFFGPCKKRLRRVLRERYLGPERQLAEVEGRERVVIAGVNAGSGDRSRKIVWAGELRTVMSFAEAWARLRDDRYERMRADEWTPLHLEPIREYGHLVGYRQHGREHAEESRDHPGEYAWWDDLVPRQMRKGRVGGATGTTLRLKPGVKWWDGFPLDACFVLRNRFWADGAGLAFDAELIRLLEAAQPNADGVDAAAPFGRNGRGHANGKRGTYLELEGRVSESIVRWLDARVPAPFPDRAEPDTRARTPPSRRRC